MFRDDSEEGHDRASGREILLINVNECHRPHCFKH